MFLFVIIILVCQMSNLPLKTLLHPYLKSLFNQKKLFVSNLNIFQN